MEGWSERQKANYRRLQRALETACEDFNCAGLQRFEGSVMEAARKSFGHWMLIIDDLEKQMNVLDRPEVDYEKDCVRFENGWKAIFNKLSQKGISNGRAS